MRFTLIDGGMLIDGNGGPPLNDAAVLVAGDRIDQVGLRSEINVPDGNITVIDARHKTILPGFIDTHVHIMFERVRMPKMLTSPFSLKFYEAARHLRSTVEAGITTVRDAAGADLGIKQAVKQGLIVGPRLQISITALSITGGHFDGWLPSGSSFDLVPAYPGMPDPICDGVDSVRRKVREVLRAGADVVKVCSTGGVLSPTDHPEFTQFSPEELAVIVQEATYRCGVKVMAHAQGVEGIKNAVRAGVHSIEHGIYLDDEAIDLMLERGTFLVPTFLASQAVIEQGDSLPEYSVRKALEANDAHQGSIARAYAAGVPIAMGTDAGVMPHGTNLRELGLMSEIGMTPMDIIVSATKIAAECLGWQNRIGTVETGKLADLVIAGVDPLHDVRALENVDNIKLVMKGGRILKDIL